MTGQRAPRPLHCPGPHPAARARGCLRPGGRARRAEPTRRKGLRRGAPGRQGPRGGPPAASRPKCKALTRPREEGGALLLPRPATRQPWPAPRPGLRPRFPGRGAAQASTRRSQRMLEGEAGGRARREAPAAEVPERNRWRGAGECGGGRALAGPAGAGGGRGFSSRGTSRGPPGTPTPHRKPWKNREVPGKPWTQPSILCVPELSRSSPRRAGPPDGKVWRTFRRAPGGKTRADPAPRFLTQRIFVASGTRDTSMPHPQHWHLLYATFWSWFPALEKLHVSRVPWCRLASVGV